MPNWFQHKFIAIFLYEHARYHTPSSFYFLSIKSGRWFFLSELFHDILFFRIHNIEFRELLQIVLFRTEDKTKTNQTLVKLLL